MEFNDAGAYTEAMAFFQIQETPSVFINTDFIERFHYASDIEGTGNLTIHFVSGENISFTGTQGPIAHELLIEVLGNEGAAEE
jgi:hypothetical protein